MTVREIPRINVASMLPVSLVNGPGKRSVIWVQGCRFRCKGCFNEELQPFEEKRLLTAHEILNEVPKDRVEGVTISGGEPFCQAESLCSFAEMIGRLGLSLMVYTGFEHEELAKSADPHIIRFLSCIDILVDGRYKQEIPSKRKWAGSGNQNILFLTDRYKSDADDSGGYRYEEFHIDLNGTLTHTGFTGDRLP